MPKGNVPEGNVPAGMVKVAIQIRDEEGRLWEPEWLSARIVYEDSRKGIYCLLNTPFWAPFALGDLVEARFRRNGDRFVTALHRRGGRTAHMLVFPADVDREAVQTLVEAWGATGSWVEMFAGGTALTVAVDRLDGGRPTQAELDLIVATRWLELEDILLLADPDEQPDHPVFRRVVAA